MTTISEIIDNFSLLEEWDDRYRYLIELGRSLAPLPDAARIDANKVQGCASQVWLSTSVRPGSPNGPPGAVLTFVGDSDAHGNTFHFHISSLDILHIRRGLNERGSNDFCAASLDQLDFTPRLCDGEVAALDEAALLEFDALQFATCTFVSVARFLRVALAGGGEFGFFVVVSTSQIVESLAQALFRG